MSTTRTMLAKLLPQYCATLIARVHYASSTCRAVSTRINPDPCSGRSALTLLQHHVRYRHSTAEVGRLNHIAIAVPSLASAAARYRDVLGAQVSQPQPLPEHGVTVVFVNLPNTKIELLEPLGDASPIAKFLAKNPSGGLHHICLEVDNIRASLDAVSGSLRVLDPEPKIGAHGTPVAFLHPKDADGVLVELEQVSK